MRTPNPSEIPKLDVPSWHSSFTRTQMALRTLWELRDANILENTQEGYALTTDGQELMEAIKEVHHWADKWETRTQK